MSKATRDTESGLKSSFQSRDTADHARRMFKSTLDLVRTLDEITKRKSVLRDLFSSETTYYRGRLKEYCERLIFLDPLEYGRKVEELLWRKVFYDAIQTMKQFKKNAKLLPSYQVHLTAASGFYHQLLFRLQYEFGVKMGRYIDCSYQESRFLTGNGQMATKYDEKVISWAERACHRCLVYLGDLARYAKEYDGDRSWLAAQRFYYEAQYLAPDNGMPHNQLGTLVGMRYYGLDAAYHYIRCMASSSKFQGASGNLRRVFEKNRKRYAEMSSRALKEGSPKQQRVQDVKSFSINFLYLMDVLYNPSETTCSLDAKELQVLCKSVLQDFHVAMFHPNPEGRRQKLDDEKMAYLDDEIILKIVVLIIMVVHKLQSQGSRQVAAAIAMNLALFSQILNHVLTRLQTAFYAAENPQTTSREGSWDPQGAGESLSTPSQEEVESRPKVTESDSTDSEENEPELTSKEIERQRKMARLRRRRRRRTNDELDLSEGEEDYESSEVLTMISDDEEEFKFLKGDIESSSSDSEESTSLMISQELRQGFLPSATTEQLQEDLSKLNRPGAQKAYASSNASVSLHSLLSGALTHNFVGNEDDLQRMSSDLLSLNPLKVITSFNGVDEGDFCTQIAQGKQHVSVPPGFDLDPEAQHVAEISRKLAAFNIDTDTNSSLFTDSDQGDSTETESVIDRNEAREKRLEHVLQVIAGNGLLCTIKVLSDWLIRQPQIIQTCAQSSPSLWSRLSFFLNFLPQETMIAMSNLFKNKRLLPHIQALHPSGDEWKQVFPLREDIHLYKMAVMAEAHSSIDFAKQMYLTSMEECLLRICCLRSFGYQVSRLTGSSFTYQQDKQMFFGPLIDPNNPDQKAQVKMEDMDARRNQLMKDMAQLRLQAEVSQLKDTVQRGVNHHLPPYLVPDPSALCSSLNVIKLLVQSTRFIFIVPIAVIDHLDEMKKDSPEARDAIRWLEAEFSKGNRYIRAQKYHERPNKGQRFLRRKDKDAWCLLQIVDCCKYLTQQNPDCHPTGLASILTNENFNTHTSAKVRQLVQIVQEEGLVIHNVREFHAKWKDQWQKKG